MPGGVGDGADRKVTRGRHRTSAVAAAGHMARTGGSLHGEVGAARASAGRLGRPSTVGLAGRATRTGLSLEVAVAVPLLVVTPGLVETERLRSTSGDESRGGAWHGTQWFEMTA